MPEWYTINSPDVVFDNISGELVVLNLRSGNYFSFNQLGAFIFNALEKGFSTEQLSLFLAEHSLGDAHTVARYTEQLMRYQLFRRGESAPANVSLTDLREFFSTANLEQRSAVDPDPRIEIHSNLQDLLLLDPVHDVDSRSTLN